MSSKQRYISSELTHFVGRTERTPEDQYKILSKIINEAKLSHQLSDNIKAGNASGVCMRVCPKAKLSSNEMFYPEVVCFCDIPIGDLNIHIQKYSPFGLSFEKKFIVQHGGSPVYYVPKEAAVKANMLARIGKSKGELFDKILPELEAYLGFDYKTIHSLPDSDSSNIDTKLKLNTFLKLHVLSYIKFFDHKLPDNHEENYYFEREWRIVGSLKFGISDIRRILVPKSYARQFREDFPCYNGELTEK